MCNFLKKREMCLAANKLYCEKKDELPKKRWIAVKKLNDRKKNHLVVEPEERWAEPVAVATADCWVVVVQRSAVVVGADLVESKI